MSTDSVLEKRTAGRGQEIAFRAGLVAQALGLGALAVLYPLENPFYTAGLMLFELGVLVSAAFLPARSRLVRIMIAGSAFAGLAMQAAGAFVAPEEYAVLLLLAGVGLVCAAAAALAAGEVRGPARLEGLLLAAGLPAMALVNLAGKEHRAVNSLGFSVLFLLLLSLAGKKLRQPLLSKSQKPDVRKHLTSKQ